MRHLMMLLLVFGFSTVLYSDDDDFYSDQPYDSSGQPNYRYKGLSGKRYQYDLNNPADQIRYEVDPAAQLRDSINVDPRIELDQGMDVWGGGAEQ
jgi:hypothetical protein